MTGFKHANDTAMGNLNYERNENDAYYTQEWCTVGLAEWAEKMFPDVNKWWEPACGSGQMVDVLRKRGWDVYESGLDDEVGRGNDLVDFLAPMPGFHSKRGIVTNPPYGELAEQFIRKALTLTKKHELPVLMLMRHEYDCAKGRVDLFNQPPFVGKLVYTTRPRWIPNTTGAPRHNYAVYAWRHGFTGSPTLHYHVK